MTDGRSLGFTAGTSMTIPLDQLGAPGVQGDLVIVAMFDDRDNDDPLRHTDRSVRPFEAKARLAKSALSIHDLNGAIEAGDGSSFLITDVDVVRFEVRTETGTLAIHVNDRHELATASATLEATDPRAARLAFLAMMNSFFDRLSYLAAVPVHIQLTIVRDVRHEVQYMTFVSPPRAAQVSPGEETLANEMRAVYALYREAMNATSPYYRVLCFHKIMEGLLGSLRTSIQKRARTLRLTLPMAKILVPDHDDMPAGLRPFVGKPLKAFFDTFLSKQFRDAMAHFNLKDRGALDVSSPADAGRYVDVAFVSDLCARALIASHETALRTLLAAESAAAVQTDRGTPLTPAPPSSPPPAGRAPPGSSSRSRS